MPTTYDPQLAPVREGSGASTGGPVAAGAIPPPILEVLEAYVDAAGSADVLEGPWRDRGWVGRTLKGRGGRRMASDTPMIIGSLSPDSGWGPRGSHLTIARDTPPLQLNLPFPDVPSLGQIARCPSLAPRPPNAVPHLFPWDIADAALLQDPDWYLEVL